MSKGIGFMLFMAFLMPLELFAQFAGGSGTLGDPYQVATSDQLDEVRNYLTSHFIQTADIDLGGNNPAGDYYHSGLGWVPIGQFNNEFTGSYNGDGFKITGLYMQRIAAGVRAGLFGYIDTDASLVDIHLLDVAVTGNSAVGGLLGENSNGSVSNCSVTGTVAGVSNVGGLVGLNGSGNGSVSLSYANVAVSGSNSGVLVGNNSSGNVNTSFTEGSSPNASGGLVGRNNFGIVINSYSTVDGADGGLVGYNTGSVTITYTAGTSDTGGLIAADGGGSELGNYWNSDSGSPDNGFGMALTDAEMKQQANFTSWNFSSIWAIDEGVSYPYLKNNPPVIPLEIPALVSPVDEATGIEDSVTLVWNAVPNAESYTLERSETEDFSNVGEFYLLEENITDTTFFIPLLTPDLTLYWRIKAVSTDQESDWSDTFSFTSSATSSMPDDIVLISPLDMAADQSLEITFNWHLDVFADEYEFQLDETGAFTSPVATYTGTDTTFTPGVLTSGTTYYWRVRALSDYGEVAWADAFSFTTEVAAPLPPDLIYPENDATGLEDNVTAVWSLVEGADSYIFEGSEAENFDDPDNYIVEGITDTMLFIPELPPSKELFWRVKTVSGEQESEWSEVFSFFTSENSLMPDPITLISPFDMAENLFTNVSLVWHSDIYADEYQIQVDTLDGFISPVADMIKADTNTTTGVLNEGTTYYWRVRGINVYGEAGWSQIFSFKTLETLPDAPQLLIPADGTTGVEDTLTIRWSAIENADSYNLEVSNVEDFNSEDNFLVEGIEDTTFFGEGLPPSVTFYWRVKAVVGNQESEWSEVFHFTTSSNSAKPKSISLIAPENNAEDQPLETIFLWNADEYAEEYQFQLSQNSAFSAMVKDSVMNDTTIELSSLDEGQTYFWRVRGKNVYLDGDWSDVFSFTTHQELSMIPTLIYPQNGASGLRDSVVFVWNSVANTLNYELQGSYTQDFSEGIFGSDMLVDTSQTVHVLPPDSLLYWRVRGIFESGVGEWSQIWSFKTSPTSSFPETPVLYLPEDEETDTELSLDLQWLPDKKSEQFALHVNYDIEISEEQNFSSLHDGFEEIQDTTISIEGLDENTKYYWRVRGNNDYGTGEWSETWSFTTKVLTSVEEENVVPKEIALMQNYPNPFNPSTVIRYDLPAIGSVDLRVFDMLGREVATLVNEANKPAGRYSVTFNAADLSSGMYIYRLKSGSIVLYKKITLIK